MWCVSLGTGVTEGAGDAKGVGVSEGTGETDGVGDVEGVGDAEGGGSNGDNVSPVPLSMIVIGCASVAAPMPIRALRWPLAFGVKVTLIVQLAPAGSS